MSLQISNLNHIKVISINGNEYFMECYEDTNLNFTASSNNFGFFDIEGSTFVLNSSFINNEVIIKVFK